jgi:hypothetical protein
MIFIMNIMVQDGKILALVDWEDAGWYPEYLSPSQSSTDDWWYYEAEIFPFPLMNLLIMCTSRVAVSLKLLLFRAKVFFGSHHTHVSSGLGHDRNRHTAVVRSEVQRWNFHINPNSQSMDTVWSET